MCWRAIVVVVIMAYCICSSKSGSSSGSSSSINRIVGREDGHIVSNERCGPKCDLRVVDNE